MLLHHRRKKVYILVYLGDGNSRLVYIYYHKLLGGNVILTSFFFNLICSYEDFCKKVEGYQKRRDSLERGNV